MLRGVDQVTNIILEDVEERVFSKDQEMVVDKSDVNLFRGDDMSPSSSALIYRSLVALYNEEKDKETDWSKVRANPVTPVCHSHVSYKHDLNQLEYLLFKRRISEASAFCTSSFLTDFFISSKRTTSRRVRPFSY